MGGHEGVGVEVSVGVSVGFAKVAVLAGAVEVAVSACEGGVVLHAAKLRLSRTSRNNLMR